MVVADSKSRVAADDSLLSLLTPPVDAIDDLQSFQLPFIASLVRSLLISLLLLYTEEANQKLN
jgi:hypothetical protein